jgi:diaminopimelate epimerase
VFAPSADRDLPSRNGNGRVTGHALITGVMMRDFLKMHGLGNDFVVIDARTEPFQPTPAETQALADRRRGIGCDQFIVIEPATEPDAAAFMRIRNADGSEVAACGNASRCVGSLLMNERGVDAVTIQTLAGLIHARRADGGLVSVDMGRARLDWREIPLAEAMDTLELPLAEGGVSGPCAVGMGNPHTVFFVSDAEAVDVAAIGSRFERHPLFPERTNVEFVSVIGPGRLRMRVWERGAGITQACGTGACATAVAATRRGLSGRSSTVVLDGGELRIDWLDTGNVRMTGPAAISFSGRLPL